MGRASSCCPLPCSAFPLLLCSVCLVGSRVLQHLEPKLLYPGPVGPRHPGGPSCFLSLLMVKWTGSCFCSHLAGVALALLGLGWELDTWFSIQSIDPVVTLGFPACTFWASVPTSLQGED